MATAAAPPAARQHWPELTGIKGGVHHGGQAPSRLRWSERPVMRQMPVVRSGDHLCRKNEL
jgi:hypothetical protein